VPACGPPTCLNLGQSLQSGAQGNQALKSRRVGRGAVERATQVGVLFRVRRGKRDHMRMAAGASHSIGLPTKERPGFSTGR